MFPLRPHPFHHLYQIHSVAMFLILHSTSLSFTHHQPRLLLPQMNHQSPINLLLLAGQLTRPILLPIFPIINTNFLQSSQLNSLPLAHILSKLVSLMLEFLHLIITTSWLSHLMKNQPASTKPVSISAGGMQCNAKLRPCSQIILGMLFPLPHMFI